MAAVSRQTTTFRLRERFRRETVRRLDVWPRWVTPRGMSGDGATPIVVLYKKTRLLVENLVHSIIATRATDDTVANADAARDGAEPIAGGDADAW
jgi:hypothetical protein